MSKPTLRVVSLTLVLVLLITPMAVLADHDPFTLHGTVFRDENGDNVMDAEDTGMEGITIELIITAGATFYDSTKTDADGSYEITGLSVETYTAIVEDLVGFDDSVANSVEFTVEVQNVPNIDFGKLPLAEGTISGTVYNDINRSGFFDDGESLPDVSVRLIDNNGAEPPPPVTTNALGAYKFTDLLPGSYTVVETDPDGFYSITPNTVVVTLPTDDSMDVVVDFLDFIPVEGEVPRIDLLLMKFFDISLLEFQALRGTEGWGYGNIAKAYFISQLSKTPLGEIIALRETMGWGKVMKAFLGQAGLKGYNLGLIVSDREVPNSVQKLIESCGSIETPEEVQELYGMGASNGAIKKACRLAGEVDSEFETLVEALGLLKIHNQKQVREILQEGFASEATSGNQGPPPCKGKNKNDEGCN
jgi:hypothetical protein